MTSTALLPPELEPAASGPEPLRPATPIVDIVVPVYNEAHVIESSIGRLHAHLTETFPFSWRITIADNASTDATWDRARTLAALLPGVRALHLDRKGRGRALRAAWSASDARVVAYMDVDLSTDLSALLPLVAPLVTGHSDVAIGSRLAHGARVVRGPRREIISRTYNRMLRLTFRNGFRDAQCGFKAVRSDVARALLPRIEDEAWFFDTELLLLAERAGLRIAEVPVDWVDDPDSRVKVAHTAWEDVKGMARMARRFWVDGEVVAAPRRRGPAVPAGNGAQLVRFAGVGIASTVAYLAAFLLLRGPLGDQAANAVALSATMFANTAAHRRWTFDQRGARGRAGTWSRAIAVHAAGLALTAGALQLAATVAGTDLVTALVLVGVASALSTALRLVLLPTWVFRDRPVRSDQS